MVAYQPVVQACGKPHSCTTLPVHMSLDGLKVSGWDMRTVKMIKVWVAITFLKFWYTKIVELGPETIE